MKPESELMRHVIDALLFSNAIYVSDVVHDYLNEVANLVLEKHLIESDLDVLHVHRYRLNLVLWFYFLGIHITDPDIFLRIMYTDSFLADYYAKIEFKNEIPSGKDVITIINELILINSGERNIIHNVCNSIDSRSGIHSNRYEMLKSVDMINENLFYFHFTYQEVLDFTRQLLKDSEGEKERVFRRSYDFWNPTNFMILAYMGTNLEIPVNGNIKKLKKRSPGNTSEIPTGFAGDPSRWKDMQGLRSELY